MTTLKQPSRYVVIVDYDFHVGLLKNRSATLSEVNMEIGIAHIWTDDVIDFVGIIPIIGTIITQSLCTKTVYKGWSSTDINESESPFLPGGAVLLDDGHR